MSNAREAILASLERARPPRSDAPAAMTAPVAPADPLGALRDRLTEAGGKFQSCRRGEWLEQIEWPIDPANVEHLYSASPDLASRGAGRSARADRDLDVLDLCVLRADFAVVENGAVWHVPSTPRERVAALLAKHLVVLVDAEELVATLHQAYERIDLAGVAFGWFICGPSKTADIEQSLVLGAHGPCSMSLVVIAG